MRVLMVFVSVLFDVVFGIDTFLSFFSFCTSNVFRCI